MVQAETQAERAFDQVVGWLEHFEPLEDPRQAGKVWYPLDEVLLLCLVAVLAAAESWVEIAEFGKKKLELLRRFLPSRTARRRTTSWATCSRRSMPKRSSAASSPGSARWPSSVPTSSPSTARHCGAPTRRAGGRRQST
jgi:hypothetical protein